MRQYDTLTSRRWDSGHPLWPKKKDGESYKRLTGGAGAIVQKLKDDGEIDLCWSVTSILNWTTNAWLGNWYRDVGIRAGLSAKSEEEAKQLFNNETNVASDRGTLLHQCVETYLKTGQKPDDPLDAKCMDTMIEAIVSLGIDPSTLGSEKIVCGSVGHVKCGGTIDLCNDQCVIDMKFPKSNRKPYLTECSQLVTYDNLLDIAPNDNRRLINIYVNQETGELIGTKEWDEEEIERAEEVFFACANLSELLMEI